MFHTRRLIVIMSVVLFTDFLNSGLPYAQPVEPDPMELDHDIDGYVWHITKAYPIY